MEIILNGNTLEGGLDQYISMVQEKEFAGPSPANSERRLLVGVHDIHDLPGHDANVQLRRPRVRDPASLRGNATCPEAAGAGLRQNGAVGRIAGRNRRRIEKCSCSRAPF
jgi:hypothetical protein